MNVQCYLTVSNGAGAEWGRGRSTQLQAAEESSSIECHRQRTISRRSLLPRCSDPRNKLRLDCKLNTYFLKICVERASVGALDELTANDVFASKMLAPTCNTHESILQKTRMCSVCLPFMFSLELKMNKQTME